MPEQLPRRNLRELIQTGFSMVEIMIAVSVAGILTTLGVMWVQQYLLKARQAEALKNLDVITSVYVAELGSDINSIPLPNTHRIAVADPGMPGSYTDDFNQPNFLGISLTERPRYKYWFAHGLVTCTLEGTTSNFVILAIAESRQIGCTNEPSDFLMMGVTLTGEKRTFRMRDVTKAGCAETTSALFTSVSLNNFCSASTQVVSINPPPPPSVTPTPPPSPTPSITSTTTTTASTGAVTSTGGGCGASITGYYSSTAYYLCGAIDTPTVGSVTTTTSSTTTATTWGGTTATTTTTSSTTATTWGGTTTTTTTTSSTTATTWGGTTPTTSSSTTTTTTGGTTTTTGGTTTTSTSSTTTSSGGESVVETCNCEEGAFLAPATWTICYCCDDSANGIAYCGTTDDGCSDGYSGPRECIP